MEGSQEIPGVLVEGTDPATVSWGKSSTVGVTAAVAQMVLAVGAFIAAWQTKDSTLIAGAVTPAITGGLTLATVVYGRMKQAEAQIYAAPTALGKAKVGVDTLDVIGHEIAQGLRDANVKPGGLLTVAVDGSVIHRTVT